MKKYALLFAVFLAALCRGTYGDAAVGGLISISDADTETVLDGATVQATFENLIDAAFEVYCPLSAEECCEYFDFEEINVDDTVDLDGAFDTTLTLEEDSDENDGQSTVLIVTSFDSSVLVEFCTHETDESLSGFEDIVTEITVELLEDNRQAILDNSGINITDVWLVTHDHDSGSSQIKTSFFTAPVILLVAVFFR